MSSSRRPALALGLVGAILFIEARAEADLTTLQVIGERGQSAAQTRRDRYECHQWAIAQSGAGPGGAGQESEVPRGQRVLAAAGTGAALGGLVRAVQHKDPANGMLAGAAIGAVIAAVRTAPPQSAAGADADPYLRALSACLEGRGYRLEWPGTQAAANR
jgi:hypothetical protein